MHKKILNDATQEQLSEFLDDSLAKIKNFDNDLYEEMEIDLYKHVYGCHFTEWLMNKALSCMINEDGTSGKHWNIEQTNNVAKQLNIDFTHYNQYDFCYVMNMLYSDYYGIGSLDAMTYGKMAKKFIEDKDAKEGKALNYYLLIAN